MSRWLRWSGLTVVIVVGALLAGCVGGDDEDGGTDAIPTSGSADSTDVALAEADVTVMLGQPHELAIQLSAPSAPAGEITFGIKNAGALPHQFAIVKHDGDPSTLPVAQVNVDTTQVEILGDSGNMDPGATAEITLDLEPGSYVIFSNTGGHYTGGMFTGFTVE